MKMLILAQGFNVFDLSGEAVAGPLDTSSRIGLICGLLQPSEKVSW